MLCEGLSTETPEQHKHTVKKKLPDQLIADMVKQTGSSTGSSNSIALAIVVPTVIVGIGKITVNLILKVVLTFILAFFYTYTMPCLLGYERLAGLTVHPPPPPKIDGGFMFFAWVSSATKILFLKKVDFVADIKS